MGEHPAPSPAPEPALDRSVLDELVRQLGGPPDMQADLIGSYLDESQGQIASLSSAAGSGDTTTVAAVAHALRSSSAVLGATTLAGLLERLERAARSTPPEIPALAIEVHAEYGRVTDSMGRL